jgi:hypothetical protein
MSRRLVAAFDALVLVAVMAALPASADVPYCSSGGVTFSTGHPVTDTCTITVAPGSHHFTLSWRTDTTARITVESEDDLTVACDVQGGSGDCAVEHATDVEHSECIDISYCVRLQGVFSTASEQSVTLTLEAPAVGDCQPLCPSVLVGSVQLRVTGASPDADPEPDPRCPPPSTCPDYVLYDSKWTSDETGTVSIRYRINPKQPWVAEDAAIRAIRGAFDVWEAATPSVRFEFMGITDLPAVPGDGENVVAWGVAPATSLIPVAVTYPQTQGGEISEADVIFNIAVPAVVYECAQANDACDDHESDYFDNAPVIDIQDVMTHEVGHVIGLGHVTDAERHRHLTMYPSISAASGYVDMEMRTLGLGDILGARAHYPCDCPAPVVYEP